MASVIWIVEAALFVTIVDLIARDARIPNSRHKEATFSPSSNRAMNGRNSSVIAHSFQDTEHLQAQNTGGRDVCSRFPGRVSWRMRFDLMVPPPRFERGTSRSTI